MPRKILLADDSVTAQNMGRKILVDAGYEVVTVNNGSAALKRVNESKPDLVVLDVYMPGYSGLEVCQRLKEASETAHIPVLLTVGKLEPFKPDEARRARADGHIVKPFEASELLSALARLEDRIVASAEQQKLNRKTPGDNGSAGMGTSGSDTSWRDRLRFPAKKKEKKETETPPADANFHDFRRSKAKTVSESPVAAKPAAREKETVVVPDIPRDITADELDALSAVAASLQSATPSESSAPAAESQSAQIPVAETPALEVPSVTPGPEIMNIASFAQEAAPIDRQDEPIFAAAPAPQENLEAPAAEAAAASEQSAAAEHSEAKTEAPEVANSFVDESDVQEFKVQESRLEESLPGTSTPEEPPLVVAQVEAPRTAEATAAIVAEQTRSIEPALPAPTAVSVQETAEPEGPPPSDEELAQALRLLTPATGSAETSMPSHEMLAAAGQLLAEEAARNAFSQPRWIAEPVALTPEEASASLEAEMFGKFVADVAGEITAPAAGQPSSSTEPVSEAVAESAAASTAQTEIQPVLTAVPEIAQEMAQQASAPTLPADAPDQAPAATFADLAPPQEAAADCVAQSIVAHETIAEERIAQGAAEQGAQLDAPQVEASAAPECAAEVAHEDSIPEAGGQPDMSKRGKPTSAKLKELQSVEPAPTETLEAPKTMAAAASADGSSTSGPDPSAIASIVESVLADLRPKIVEEITRKLSRK